VIQIEKFALNLPRAPANFSIITLEPNMSAMLTYLQAEPVGVTRL
jgi:hypothetical protein